MAKKKYLRDLYYNSLRDANERAANLRRWGYQVLVQRQGKGYWIWKWHKSAGYE